MSQEPEAARLQARSLVTGYEGRTIIDGLDIAIPDGSFTVIIGPNACGKSTLLRSLARLIKPTGGDDPAGRGEHRPHEDQGSSRVPSACCRRHPSHPTESPWETLCLAGRHPHQTVFKRWGEDDERAVRLALSRRG